VGLFSKKDPCAICGGKVKGLLPSKIDGQYVCSDCYGFVDIPDNGVKNMTLDGFRAYMAFREENQMLKEQFEKTDIVDFGFFGSKYVFDLVHGYMCLDKNLNKTIFEAKHIKSFTIREDSALLFEGSIDGLRRYKSAVPEKVAALVPTIQQFMAQVRMQQNMNRLIDTLDDGQRNNSTGTNRMPQIDLPEPFNKFYIEIRFDHPYWNVYRDEITGPRFSNTQPDPNDYMRSYMNEVQNMEQLACALMSMAFPNSPDLRNDTVAGAAGNAGAAAAAPSADVAAELQRYKTLMDQGILTEEEFTAKKRQLLGI